MEFVRSQRSSPEHDPNTRHVIYGLVSLQKWFASADDY